MIKAGELQIRKLVIYSSIPVLVLALIVAVSAEAWLRFNYRTIAEITGMNEWKDGTGNNLTFYWDRYHPKYGWTNLPGYRSDAKVPFKVTINSQGLRSEREYPLKRTAGVKRVAVLGDSFTFGEDVDDDQTLPYYLERFTRGMEIMNFGVHGHGLGEMTLRLEEEVFAYSPDHVLLVVAIPPDLERTVLSSYNHPKPAFSIVNGKLAMANVPVPISWRQRFIVRHSYLLAWLFGRSYTKTETDEVILTVSAELLKRAKRLCDERKIALTVVLIAGPSWTRIMDTVPEIAGWMKDGQRMVSAVGGEVLDLIEFLKNMQRQKHDVAARENIHWSGRGNCFLAENLARVLAEKHQEWRLSYRAPATVCP